MEAQGLPARCRPLLGLRRAAARQSPGGGGAEGSTAKPEDARDRGPAENRDWRQEPGRERRGRPPAGLGRVDWEENHPWEPRGRIPEGGEEK